LAEVRLKLIETGMRNRLIHTPRAAKRTRSLPIVGANADAVLAGLVRQERPVRFLPAEDLAEIDKGPTTHKMPRLAAAKAHHERRSGLQTALAPDLLQKRLHLIARDAKTAEEERGVNIHFLALGFLRWYEDEKSEAPRHAPLILLPVSLIRDAKRSSFDLKFRDEEIATNQALQERLRSDFGISLPDVPETEDWLPSAYFDAVAKAVASKRRWSIDAEGIELGFYSFSKLLMVRDLEPANWPNQALASHPIVRGLLCEGFASEAPILPEAAKLDEILSLDELVQIVDADSSQTRVIETVRAGRNLVVQGPPGTGKSQTIANIIASAVHAGKSVLFVAEKMAALNVVHDRLRKVGLEDICLELHSRTVNKRLVADRLEQTLQAAAAFGDADAVELLRFARDRLNHVAARLHVPIGETGMSPHQALAIQIAAAGRDAPDARLVEEAAHWTRNDFAEKNALIARLSNLTERAGPLSRHVYFGVNRIDLQPMDFQRLLPQLRAFAEKAGALAAYAAEIGAYFNLQDAPTLAGMKALIAMLRLAASLPPGSEPIATPLVSAPTLDRVIDAAALGVKWRRHQAPFGHIFHPAAWNAPVAGLRAPLVQGATFAAARFGKGYREAGRSLASLLSVPLPRRPAERLALVDALLASQSLSRKLSAEAGFFADLLGEAWRGKKTDFALVRAVAETIKDIIACDVRTDVKRVIDAARDGGAAACADELERAIDDFTVDFGEVVASLDLDIAAVFGSPTIDAVDLDRLAARATRWAQNGASFEEWTQFAKADRQLRATGPAILADALASGRLPFSQAGVELETAFAEACWKKAIAADPDLAAFDGRAHDALIVKFVSLEAERRRVAAERIRARHQAAIPRGARGAMGLIRGEIGRRRNHMPLRKLMQAAGDAIQKIKPVFLMSPISVAQFLPPGSIDFDLLVIDEASQVRPGDALGLIARSRQIVVVGDKKQLPPTSFFDRVIADDADPWDDDEDKSRPAAGVAPVTDLESILSLCEARGVESRMLRWHYRSRHPSLIAVSNAEFYKDLVMPPAPTTERKAKGLVLRRIAGAYDRGGQRTNAIEAEAVAEAVAEHARAKQPMTLGVVTFSTVQRDLICDRLEAKRRADPALDRFLREGGDEDVFVKNLENVQGDERDVILVSVGYGPRQAGKPLDSMAFGPISTEGGERRLNVLFTRARARCEIFVSFGSGEINLERATGEGPRVLKRFLYYAESGVLEENRPTRADFESPFEATVAAAIESFGYKVEPQVGSAGFRIDLAARDPDEPGRYLLGVECDGASYHSALWARERDRLRQEVLEGLGWRIHRIWSTDWFYRPTEQLAKLRAALESARIRPPPDAASSPARDADLPADQAPDQREGDCLIPT
jgi:very-short-patch-repair endonuclease